MHIFLTGPKRAGKSTLINAILTQYPGEVGGFRTVKTTAYLPGRFSVHLLPADGTQAPSEENLLFLCSQPSSDVIDRFNRLGCRALAYREGAQLLVMDELGPHEVDALEFQAAVWAAVEGQTPILGVLQEAASPFLDRIARHPNTLLLRVTEESRDDLAKRIPEFLNILR